MRSQGEYAPSAAWEQMLVSEKTAKIAKNAEPIFLGDLGALRAFFLRARRRCEVTLAGAGSEARLRQLQG
jgi:hypothetical protein